MTATLMIRATASTERIEVYPIETIDLSTVQVLHGGTPETPPARQTIAGELRLPTTTDVRVPAVIFMHGDLGALALSNARFAAHVALCPPCNTQLVDDERRETGPLRTDVGAADTLVQASPCERFVARFRMASVDAEVTVYRAATHGFDDPPGRHLVQVPDEPTCAP